MKPILNAIAEVINGFVDKYIAHIPEEKKQAFLGHVEELGVKAIEAGVKGAVEGGTDRLTSK